MSELRAGTSLSSPPLPDFVSGKKSKYSRYVRRLRLCYVNGNVASGIFPTSIEAPDRLAGVTKWLLSCWVCFWGVRTSSLLVSWESFAFFALHHYKIAFCASPIASRGTPISSFL
jgi:hypothetical protein